MYLVNDSTQRNVPYLGRSILHYPGGIAVAGRIVESCAYRLAYRCPHHFDRPPTLLLASCSVLEFSPFSFQVAYPNLTCVKTSDWNLTFHRSWWKWPRDVAFLCTTYTTPSFECDSSQSTKALGISSSLFGLATERWLNTRSTKGGRGVWWWGSMGWRAAMSWFMKCDIYIYTLNFDELFGIYLVYVRIAISWRVNTLMVKQIL